MSGSMQGDAPVRRQRRPRQALPRRGAAWVCIGLSGSLVAKGGVCLLFKKGFFS